jgi:hypothetical protein
MHAAVGPGMGKVLGPEYRIAPRQVCLARPKAPRPLQDPDPAPPTGATGPSPRESCSPAVSRPVPTCPSRTRPPAIRSVRPFPIVSFHNPHPRFKTDPGARVGDPASIPARRVVIGWCSPTPPSPRPRAPVTGSAVARPLRSRATLTITACPPSRFSLRPLVGESPDSP